MKSKVLRVFSLSMINIVAVADIRSLPISAEYGPSLIFFYVLAGLFFLLPCALVVAECATAWPMTGGIYIWIREAFGHRCAFFAVWTQWIYNVVWYPTILAMLVATVCYLFFPSLLHSQLALVLMIVGLFWFITLLSGLGIRFASWVSTIGTIVGAVIPLLVLMGFAIAWLLRGHATVVPVNWHTIIPVSFHPTQLAMLSGLVFGLLGIEMSATHAQDVKNPGKDYPRALLWSVLGIMFTLIVGSLAVVMVLPPEDISLTAGVIQSFAIFLKELHAVWLLPFVGVCIVFGAMAAVSAWLLGTSRCLLASARDGLLPKFFTQTNRHRAPINLLVAQALVVTVLSGLYFLFPAVNSSYWLLSAMTAQMALIVYVLMFSAFIRLRYRFPQHERPFCLRGGKLGAWVCAGIGLLTTVLIFVLGFFPPAQLNIGHVWLYEFILIGGVIVFSLLAFVVMRRPAR